MKLKHITFTGVDAMTDISDLKEIQKEYPIAEFGVLTSYNWIDNGNRYLNPAFMSNLYGFGGNLSLHICGSAAHDATCKKWEDIDELTFGCLHLFKRVQLNVSGRKDNPKYCWIPLVIGQELIVQQKGVENITLFEETVKHWTEKPFMHRDTISVLLDASGGRGIDTPIQVLKGNYKVGYAGGINPDNVAEKLHYLLTNPDVGDFWIDMESGVRTDDWFDVNKVLRVLAICKEVIRDCNIKE